MNYKDLREFIEKLKQEGELVEIDSLVDPFLEVTEISDRVLRGDGPALLFTNPKGSTIPLLTNLFGSKRRVALGMGENSVDALKEIGKLLAFLKEPNPPKGMKEALKALPIYKKVLNMAPKYTSNAECHNCIIESNEVDINKFPIQTCWPGDVAPLITWGLVVTKGPSKSRANMGIYRQQVLARNKVIMRWLSHRGGALDYKEWLADHPEQPFPISVVLGADPATILAAVTPIPDTLSEHAFAGLLRGTRTRLVRSTLSELPVPSSAEFVLEGYIYPNDVASEGPFGDHTGYYNEVEEFPVFTIERITHRKNPIYHSTYTGRPPDEPAILGVALNEVFTPILQKQFPEIVDFYLPPEGCSYRIAVVSMVKQYPGHAKRVMMGIWSYLRQFMYTKFIVVVDDDINVRSWEDVIWAITTRMDPQRDTTLIKHTPIDYLDFASPTSGLGSKMGLDATNKLPGETQREWGNPIKMDRNIVDRVSDRWSEFGLDNPRNCLNIPPNRWDKT